MSQSLNRTYEGIGYPLGAGFINWNQPQHIAGAFRARRVHESLAGEMAVLSNGEYPNEKSWAVTDLDRIEVVEHGTYIDLKGDAR
jgi:hypothetical protein